VEISDQFHVSATLTHGSVPESRVATNTHIVSGIEAIRRADRSVADVVAECESRDYLLCRNGDWLVLVYLVIKRNPNK
jgi:hypothetical protein